MREVLLSFVELCEVEDAWEEVHQVKVFVVGDGKEKRRCCHEWSRSKERREQTG